MKALLVFALVAAVKAEADPGFVYTVGTHHATPVVYNHHVATPVVYNHHVANPVVYTHHAAAPVVYTAPVLTASNTCKNEAGQLVPCLHGAAPASSVYAFNDALNVPVLAHAAAAPVEAEAAPAEGVVDVSKRSADADAEAEADPYLLYSNYYGYPYAGYYGHAYHGYHGYYGLPYGYGYYAHAGCRNNYGALVPCA